MRVLSALLACGVVAGAGLAAAAPAVYRGAYALAGGRPRVSATLVLDPGPPGAPDGARVLDVAMTRLGAAGPVTRYDVELSKRLHLIAVGGGATDFVHEHGERPDADGHFRVSMTFPHGGDWHVYADAAPTGLGQQVLRFDISLPGTPPPASPAAPTGLAGADGPYGVRFDSLDLHAGKDATLTLHVLHAGEPASDLAPFLGVAAHAVFINAADLGYVHAHAAPAGAPTHGGMGMEGMDMPTLQAGSRVPADLVLHVRAPRAGIYRLWLQFMAGGRVRTVPFVVRVA